MSARRTGSILGLLALARCATVTDVRIDDPSRVTIRGSCPAPESTVTVQGSIVPDYTHQSLTLACASPDKSRPSSGEMHIPLDDVASVIAHENPRQIGVAASLMLGGGALGLIAALAAPQVKHPRQGALLVLEVVMAAAAFGVGIWELGPGTDRVIYQRPDR